VASFNFDHAGVVIDYEVWFPAGSIGDINGDGVVNGNGLGDPMDDDVSAFVKGWMTTGHVSLRAQKAAGDLNFDGITNLADWRILNAEFPSMGAAIAAALEGESAVPEPRSCALALAAVVAAVAARNRSADRTRQLAT